MSFQQIQLQTLNLISIHCSSRRREELTSIVTCPEGMLAGGNVEVRRRGQRSYQRRQQSSWEENELVVEFLVELQGKAAGDFYFFLRFCFLFKLNHKP